MEADKKPEEANPEDTPKEASQGDEQAHDALDKPSDDAANSGVIDATDPKDKSTASAQKPKQQSPFKKSFKRFNLYILLFVLVIVVGGVIVMVSYLNGKKPAPNITVGNQSLSQDQLKQLTESNATVGGSGQTLTVQGNSNFTGQVLIRSSLDVAGTIQLGSQLTIPQLTITGNSNLSSTQINNLQVAQNAVFQSTPTFQNGMTVAGSSNFTGTVSTGGLTVTNLTLSSDAQLQVPNHIAFTGASPGRTIDFNVLGGGGTASVFGSDTNGTVTINTGNNPVAGCFVTFRYDIPFQSTPNIIIGPINQAARESEFYVTYGPDDQTETPSPTTKFQICTYSPAPPNQVFDYSYFITTNN